MLDLDALDFAKGGGLVTVVAQDAVTGALLMVAHADREALARTVESGEMHYRSRSRGAWHKGATSGNVQRVVSLAPDCDGDAVLARVLPAGPACHTGAVSCFGEAGEAADELGRLDATIAARGAPPNIDDRSPSAGDNHRTSAAPILTTPASGEHRAPPDAPEDAPGHAPTRPSYTQRLLNDRNLRLKKLGEEAAELVTACADGDRERAVEEAADLIYHTLVALHAAGASLADVRRALSARRR